MTIRIRVANEVQFRVAGHIRVGALDQKFDFGLTAERLNEQELGDLLYNPTDRSIRDVLLRVVRSWADVLDEDGNPMPYSPEALTGLWAEYPGLMALTLSAYSDAIGAKGRRKN